MRLRARAEHSPPRDPRARGHVLDRVLVLLFAAAIVATIVSLQRESRARGFTALDTTRSRVEPPWGWIDPRWRDLVAHRLAALGVLDNEDPATPARIADELAQLPFLVEVGVPQPLWPDGQRVPVRFADVVACVRVGRWFQPVGSDGSLLPGRWPSPPAAGAGWLPVVGPVDIAPPDLKPGEVLSGAGVSGALAIAASMWKHLDDEAIARLGRVVIDASRAHATSVEEPGARLWLEHGREVLFGRSPDLDQPGELPVLLKWRSLALALRELHRPEGFDWGVCDVRWDQAELSPRPGRVEPPEAQLGAQPVREAREEAPPARRSRIR